MAKDTKARIQTAALELIARQGVQRTSLRQIADQLGITKPALYYHFASRDDLVRSLLQPLLDECETMIIELERSGGDDPRRVLEECFDLLYRHRNVINSLVRDPTTLSELDLGNRLINWRLRVIAMVAGPRPSLAARVRAVVAVGGLADCTVLFDDHPVEKVRPAALEAALATLDRPEPVRRPARRRAPTSPRSSSRSR
ncbi:TetR/AcrR family transcriptional regulator [Microlunatus parietis]|uniref:AcrR family transcriptional regulator n=1 Tax=Microlunatus parietis TaxID=682979 RepID=A0A7Y9I4W1_9ACTN|nr:TetR/AcrR family transcriptional regulator [Microlunatus parietis]NYE70331.1 AcrR family transcriptional regulator [Microlunatus parietis]